MSSSSLSSLWSTIDIEQLQARGLESLHQYLRHSPDQHVAKVVIALTGFPQAASIQRHSLHRRKGFGTEMPAIRRKKPGPAQHITGSNRLDRHSPQLRIKSFQ